MKHLISSVLAILATAALADDVIWQTDWTTPGDPMNGTSHVVATPDGGAFATHIDSQTSGKWGDTYYSTGVVKFSPAGTVQWHDYFGNARGAFLGFDSFGNFYATIRPSALNSYTELSPRTRKYAPNGTMLWEYSQGQGRTSLDMIVESDGTWFLAVGGYNESSRFQKISALTIIDMGFCWFVNTGPGAMLQ
ncbi:MAG: hypothetical protein ACR2HJ_09155 [Fimbriimonadales bacterium]